MKLAGFGICGLEKQSLSVQLGHGGRLECDRADGVRFLPWFWCFKHCDAVLYRNELCSNKMKGKTAVLIGESSCLSKFSSTGVVQRVGQTLSYFSCKLCLPVVRCGNREVVRGSNFQEWKWLKCRFLSLFISFHHWWKTTSVAMMGGFIVRKCSICENCAAQWLRKWKAVEKPIRNVVVARAGGNFPGQKGRRDFKCLLPLNSVFAGPFPTTVFFSSNLLMKMQDTD